MFDHIFILVNRFRTDIDCHCRNFIQIDKFVPYSKLFNSRLRIIR